MTKLRWIHVREAIDILAPGYFKQNHGISPDKIHSVEYGLVAPLPQAYKDFLVAMGADPNFNAFGRSIGDFETLSSRHPSRHYPPNLFCIAHDGDNDLDNPINLFIDLRMQEEYDAILFEYEPYNQFRPEHVVRLRSSFMEFVTRQVLLRFVNFDQASSCYWPDKLAAHLMHRNYVSSLPPSPNLFYFTKNENHVMIELIEDGHGYTESHVSLRGNVGDVMEELDFLQKEFLHRDDPNAKI